VLVGNNDRERIAVVFQEWQEALAVKIESFDNGILPVFISVCPAEENGTYQF
jgi:hypothetical protein